MATIKILALIYALLYSQISNGSILFDNGEPIGGMGQWIGKKRDGIRPRIANDFILDSYTEVTGVTFWTVEDGLWDGTLEYYLFDDDQGLPSVNPIAGFISGNAVNVERILTGSYRIGLQYQYNFEFESPLLLKGNTIFWLGLHMQTFSGSSATNSGNGIFWEVSNSQGFGAEMVVSETKTSGPRWREITDGVDPRSDGSFQLHGNVVSVSEPSMTTLIGMGLFGLTLGSALR